VSNPFELAQKPLHKSTLCASGQSTRYGVLKSVVGSHQNNFPQDGKGVGKLNNVRKYRGVWEALRMAIENWCEFLRVIANLLP